MTGADIAGQLIKISNRIEVGSSYSRFRDLLSEVLPSLDQLLDELHDFQNVGSFDPELRDFRDDLIKMHDVLHRPTLKKFIDHKFLRPNPTDVALLHRVASHIAGHPIDGTSPVVPKVIEPLTDKQQQVVDILAGSKVPLTGKQIVQAFEHQYGELISESTLTRHIVPVLKERRRLINKRGVGYYFPEG